MKECPKCGTLYTDSTLAYCLSDGTPLIVQITGEKTEKFSNTDIVTEQLSEQNTDAKTDAETVVRTKPANLPTEETLVQTTQAVERKGVSPIWILATFGLLGIILIGGVSFWIFSDKLLGVEIASNKSNSNSDSNSDSNSNYANSQKNSTGENRTDNTNGPPTATPTQEPTAKPTKTATPKPNTYRVANVKSNDVLYIRPQAGNLKVVVGKIPPNGKGIKIIGGSKRVGKSRWVLISYRGKKGWVNSKFIRKE